MIHSYVNVDHCVYVDWDDRLKDMDVDVVEVLDDLEDTQHVVHYFVYYVDCIEYLHILFLYHPLMHLAQVLALLMEVVLLAILVLHHLINTQHKNTHH